VIFHHHTPFTLFTPLLK
jgi:hypothetical protein